MLKKLKILKKLIKFNNINGYIIPKNDAYFSEFSFSNHLKKISNFSGSAGFAIILEKEVNPKVTIDIFFKKSFLLCATC